MLNALNNLSFRGMMERVGLRGSERRYKAAVTTRVDVVGGDRLPTALSLSPWDVCCLLLGE